MMYKIALHSAPRSGSTWLGNIINSHPGVKFSYQPLFSYAFKDFLGPDSSKANINKFFELLFYSNDDFINQNEGIKKGLVPRFEKESSLTHCCYKEVRYHHILPNMIENCLDLKFIFLIRHPLAVMESWRKAPREFRKDLSWDFKEEWRSGHKKNNNLPESYYGFDKWVECNSIFLSLKAQYPKRVQLVEFKELLENTAEVIDEIFAFIDLEVTPQVVDFIKSSKSINRNDAYSVFKVKEADEDWKNLPIRIINEVRNELKNSPLERYLYE